MIQKIEKVYNVLREMVISDTYIKNKQPMFYKLIFFNALMSETVQDQSLIKLAILSSHREWEGLYKNTHPDLEYCLGADCANLTQLGAKHFGISHVEIDLLRKEILEGDAEYHRLLEELRLSDQAFNKIKDLNNLRDVYHANMKLGRFSEAYSFLQEFRSMSSNYPDLKIEYAILYAGFLDNLNVSVLGDSDLGPDGHLVDFDNLLELLEIFEDHAEINQHCRFVVHYEYLGRWAKSINQYLFLIEDSYYRNIEISIPDKIPNHFEQQVMELLEVAPMRYNDNLIRKYPAQIIGLMKKHDKIVLEMAEICLDPPEFYHSFNLLYFTGNHEILWRKLLNMAFPNKLQFFLMLGYDIFPRKKSVPKNSDFPGDQLFNEFLDRLKREFPDSADLIEKELTVDYSESDDVSELNEEGE
jgi:hypothetical protein